MHWFWRGAIAFLAGWVLRLIIGVAFARLFAQTGSILLMQFTFIIIYSLELCAVLVVYGLLTRRYHSLRPSERETRCRACRYILRGISEPRCPECGERI